VKKLLALLLLLPTLAYAQNTSVTATRIRLDNGASPAVVQCVARAGSGSPESIVTGAVCDTWLRTDGGTLYLKETGTGNTGWIAVLSVSGIGSQTQAYSAKLTTIAALSDADSTFIVGSAGGWVAESGATALASLGASPVAGSSSIVTVGTITSGVWNAGAVTSSGTFTTTVSGNVLNRSGAADAAQYVALSNTSGQLYLGVERSVAGASLTGTSAWGTFLFSALGLDLLAASGHTRLATQNVIIDLTAAAKTWSASYVHRVLQVGVAGFVAGTSGADMFFRSNAYINSSGVDSYVVSDGAADVFMSAGVTKLRVTGSGTADAAITWIDAITIASSGNVTFGAHALLGATAPGAGTNGLIFAVGTAPSGMAANTAGDYAGLVEGIAERFVINESDERTRLTGLQSRVATQFDKTTDTTLANVTGLTRNVAAGLTYDFTATLYIDADATGGSKFAVGGTATATAIIYSVVLTDEGTLANTITSRQTALGGAAGQAGTTAGVVTIRGTITVNVAGTLTIQFAQNASNGTSSVLVGSTFSIRQVG